MSHLVTVEQCLLFHLKDVSIDLLELAIESGAEVKRVKVSTGGYSSEYWITEPKFQVLRRVVKWQTGETATVLSKYDRSIAGGGLPAVVEIQDRQAGNYVDRVVKILTVEVDARIPDEAFSISSIGMPVNTMINDYRKKRIVGYWTGHEISDTPIRDSVASAVVASNTESAPSRKWMVAANIAVIGFLASWLFISKLRKKGSLHS